MRVVDYSGSYILHKLRSLGLPEYILPIVRRYDDEQKAASRKGIFMVQRDYRGAGREANLSPPIDWQKDPHNSRDWMIELHRLFPLDHLFVTYDSEGELEALDQARAIAIDWIQNNPSELPQISETMTTQERQETMRNMPFGWMGMSVGIRVRYLAYLLRAAGCEGLLSSAEAKLILSSLEVHGNYLADPRCYAFWNNHAIFQDEGLFVLATYLPFLPQAKYWKKLATERNYCC